MNVAIEKLPECRAKLSAEVPADTVKETRDGVVSAFMSQAKIPGFRPGKTPRSVVEKKFRDGIENELKDRLTRSVLMEAVQNQDLELLGVASVERETFETDGTFSYISEVVVKPEVDITEEEYKNIEVEVEVRKVTDEMVDEWLGRVQENFAEYVDKDGEVEHGNQATITYEASRDGEPLVDQLKEELTPLAHRDEEFELMIPKEGQSGHEMIPGLADGIVGMKAGETREVEVSFEEDYFIEELRETSATYSVKVHGVKEAKLPEIDDELARKIGGENLDAIKGHYRQEMEAQIEREKTQQIESKILEHINKEHEFDLPKEEVFNETQYQVNQMVSNAYQQGLKPDDIDEHEKDIVDNASSRAVANLRTRYILDVIAEKEKIEVTDDELSYQIMAMAEREKKPVKKFARELRDGPGFDAIRRDIRITKTIDFLRENASVTETEAVEKEDQEES